MNTPTHTRPLTAVEQIETKIERLGWQIEAYGSMESTPLSLLREYARLWHENWTWAMARQEGLL